MFVFSFTNCIWEGFGWADVETNIKNACWTQEKNCSTSFDIYNKLADEIQCWYMQSHIYL